MSECITDILLAETNNRHTVLIVDKAKQALLVMFVRNLVCAYILVHCPHFLIDSALQLHGGNSLTSQSWEWRLLPGLLPFLVTPLCVGGGGGSGRRAPDSCPVPWLLTHANRITHTWKHYLFSYYVQGAVKMNTRTLIGTKMEKHKKMYQETLKTKKGPELCTTVGI